MSAHSLYEMFWEKMWDFLNIDRLVLNTAILGEGHGSEAKCLQGRKAITFNARHGLLFSLALQLSQKVSGDSDMTWSNISASITFDVI